MSQSTPHVFSLPSVSVSILGETYDIETTTDLYLNNNKLKSTYINYLI